ncbi:MAG: diguanylate cyclase [Pirellulaceae bacterium]|nr:diguanylate cyclase [Pirellulaceae bacterium]
MQTLATRFTQSALEMHLGNRPTSRPNCLVRIHPAAGLGQILELDQPELVLGRDEACDIQLVDDSVSRRHARIESTEEGSVISDLGSTNGTYINDERVSERKLAPGDRLRLGNQIFRFLGADGIEAEYHEAVYRMMTTDGLTQVYNKRYLLDVIERELARAARTGRPLAVLMFDVDRFKSINDTHGHLAGDEVLSELCRRARGLVRQEEVLARYGGEEFVVLMPDTNREQGRAAAERLRGVIAERPFRTERVEIPVTVSIGVAATGDRPLTAALLLDQADEQLYAAKRGGRNRVMG